MTSCKRHKTGVVEYIFGLYTKKISEKKNWKL